MNGQKSKNEKENGKELAEEELGNISGGWGENDDPAFRGSRCPRGVTERSFPEKGRCYSVSPCSKCMFLDEDDEGSSMVFSCIRYNYRKEE